MMRREALRTALGLAVILLAACTTSGSGGGGSEVAGDHPRTPQASESHMPPGSSSPLPYLATLEHNPRMSVGVGFSGTLEVSDGCVLLVPTSRTEPPPAKSYLLIFEKGYHLVRASDGSIAIAAGDGRYLWRVGDPLTGQLGGTPVGRGRYWPTEDQALASLAEPVPPTCTYDRIWGTNASIYRDAGGPDDQLPVAVPSLMGLTRPAAAQSASEAGFKIVVWEHSPESGTVRTQSPRPGAMDYPGTSIVIRLDGPR